MSSFSNLESCDRIVYGVIIHLNRSWERKTALQIYTNMLTLPFEFTLSRAHDMSAELAHEMSAF
jgi:hypothetical protein